MRSRGLDRRGMQKWELRVSTGELLPTGRYREVSRTVKGSEHFARSALRSLVVEVQQDLPRVAVRSGEPTLGDMIQGFFDRKSAGWSPNYRNQMQWVIDTKLAGDGDLFAVFVAGQELLVGDRQRRDRVDLDARGHFFRN